MQCQKADQSLYHYNGVSKLLSTICLAQKMSIFLEWKIAKILV